MSQLDPKSEEFTEAAEAAWDAAREQALTAGFPVFYHDSSLGVDIMQQPDGRRFEIHYISGALHGQNFRIVRELSASAA